jgi:hypothetical protein
MGAIKLEMADVQVAFEEFDGGCSVFVGYTQITGHLVLDVKFGENLMWKASIFADRHKTGAQASETKSTIVSRYSVCIQ